MARLLEEIGDFKLEICYSYRELADILHWNHQRVIRVLTSGGVERKHGSIWISDIKNQMPEFYESLRMILRARQEGKKVIDWPFDGEE